jgi:transaldolase
MKFFIDTANLEEIKKINELGLIDGVTTNPSLISKETDDFVSHIKKITEIVDGDISAEVIATDSKTMIEEGRKLHKIHKNIVVKVPLTEDGLAAVKVLSSEGIKTNVTLCFSPVQALMAAKAGATYISPFVGRLDDIQIDGMDLIEEIKIIYENYNFKTEILVASIRTPNHVKDAALIGADVVTVPYKVLTGLIKHPLTKIGLDKFLEDAKGHGTI